MKKLITYAAALMICFASLVTVTAQEAESRDSRSIAMAFIKNGQEKSFRGWFGYERLSSDGQAQRVDAQFSASADASGNIAGITQIQVGDMVEVFDPPLKSFPRDKEGKMLSFYMGVEGMNDANKSASYANFYTQVLRPGDVIRLELRPSYRHMFVPAEKPAGVSESSFQLVVEGVGNSGYYSSNEGGFHVWLDPVLGSKQYSLINASTGEKVGSDGWINAYTGATPSPDNVFTTGREEGVMIVPISPDYQRQQQSFYSQTFPTKFDYYGWSYPATVYALGALAGGNVGVSVQGLKPDWAAIQIEEVLPDGSLSVVKFTVADSSDWFEVVTEGSYDALVVTIFGEKEYPDGFYAGFRWVSPGSSSSSGDGGGSSSSQ